MATTRRQFLRGSAAAGVATLAVGLPRASAQTEASLIRNHPDAFVVALVGDFGTGRPVQRQVSERIHSWKPAAVFTMGDNVYSDDARVDPQALLNDRVVDHFGKFIANRTFFPSLGNHDWGDSGTPIIELDGLGGTVGPWHDTFDYLPGNGRYYDVRIGPLHAFVLHDSVEEPDGNRMGTVQAQWLEQTSRASDAPFKIVIHHYAPYVSSVNAVKRMRWPFADWGIAASFSGHWHHYERRQVDDVTYVVNGSGGAPVEFAGRRDPETVALHSRLNGACRMTVAPDAALVEFVTTDGVVQDLFVLRFEGDGPAAVPPMVPVDGGLPAGEPFTSATGRAAVIARLYFAVFERAPDLDGFEYWSTLNLPVSEVSQFFVSSPEFVGTYGSLQDRQFIDRVYRNVLGRAPDADGFTYWLGVLRRGTSRGDLMIGFSESPEFRTRTGIAG